VRVATVYKLKQYARVDKTTEEITGWESHNYAWDEVPPEPVLEDTEDEYLIYVPPETLGSDTIIEFLATHTPVFTGATPVFDSWASRNNGLGAVQSAPLNYNGSNTPTVTLSGGVANADYLVVVTGGFLCNVSEGTLDGSGGAVLTIKNVSATSGYLQIKPKGHSDFEVLVHTVEFEDWSP
jgi:hypothetical protein